MVMRERSDEARVVWLLRRSALTSVGGGMAFVGALGAGGIATIGGTDSAVAWGVLAGSFLAVSAAAGALASSDNRAALDLAIRRGLRSSLGATEPEPFLAAIPSRPPGAEPGRGGDARP